MAINKAMYTGVNQIMDAFDRNAQTPYYSVWAGKDMIFSYNEDDAEQGRVYLMENLIASEQNEHSDILKIKFHPKKEKTFITDKTPSIATLFVRVCDPNYFKGQVQPYQAQPNYGMQNLMERQLEMLNGINSRLTALEEVQEEVEEEEDSEEDVLGKIGTIINHPAVQTLIAALLPNVLTAMKPQPTQAVAGIEPELEQLDEMEAYEQEAVGEIDYTQDEQNYHNHSIQQINIALERLSQHTNSLAADLTALADMADNNPTQFKMLLGMLRK